MAASHKLGEAMVRGAKGEADNEGGSRKSNMSEQSPAISTTDAEGGAPGTPRAAPGGHPPPPVDTPRSERGSPHGQRGGLGARATAMLRSLEARVDADKAKVHRRQPPPPPSSPPPTPPTAPFTPHPPHPRATHTHTHTHKHTRTRRYEHVKLSNLTN